MRNDTQKDFEAFDEITLGDDLSQELSDETLDLIGGGLQWANFFNSIPLDQEPEHGFTDATFEPLDQEPEHGFFGSTFLRGSRDTGSAPKH